MSLATPRVAEPSAPPTDEGSTRGSHLRTIARSRGFWYPLALGIAAIATAGALMRSPIVMAGGSLVVALAVAVITYSIARRRAEQDFVLWFAQTHGLEYVGTVELPPLTPLLGAGDRRRCEHYMTGPLGGGLPLSGGIGHYVFEVREEDPDGNAQWESHDFTICVTDVEAATSLFPGIFVTKHRALANRILGGAQVYLLGLVEGGVGSSGEWLRRNHFRKVEFESSALAERCEIYVDEQQDDVRLRELFAPTFVSWLAEHPLQPYFELRAGTLVVYRPGRISDDGHLQWLLETTRDIARRILAEVAEEQSPRVA